MSEIVVHGGDTDFACGITVNFFNCDSISTNKTECKKLIAQQIFDTTRAQESYKEKDVVSSKDEGLSLWSNFTERDF